MKDILWHLSQTSKSNFKLSKVFSVNFVHFFYLKTKSVLAHHQTKGMKSKFIFVYGTLRNEASNKMAEFVRKNATLVGPATTGGQLYLVEAQRDFVYPALVVSPSDDRNDNHDGRGPQQNGATVVHGDVFQLHDQVADDPEKLAAFWKVLDEYEGGEYEKAIRKVTINNNNNSREDVEANMYVYVSSTARMKVIKNGDFLRRVV